MPLPGVRISEALGLTIDRTDLLQRRVKIDRQLVGIENGAPVFGPVKDRHNTPRMIPVPETVAVRPLNRVTSYLQTVTWPPSMTEDGRMSGGPRPTLWACRGGPDFTRFATTTPALSYEQGRA